MYREIYKTQRRGPDMAARGVGAHSAGGKASDVSQQPKKKSTEAFKKKEAQTSQTEVLVRKALVGRPAAASASVLVLLCQ